MPACDSKGRFVAGVEISVVDSTLGPLRRIVQGLGGLENAGRKAVHRLERYLNTLGTIAAAAPLMGLFGTVVGMIEIFGSQTATGSNPQQLASGISIALYNTGFGLLVAAFSRADLSYLQAVSRRRPSPSRSWPTTLPNKTSTSRSP